MKINIMTWNTQLYEYGNALFKKSIEDGLITLKKQKEILLTHLEKENSLAVLQEVPYMRKDNRTGEWKEHELFTELIKVFPEERYKMCYNVSNDHQIIMTIVVSNKGLVERAVGVNNNRCISFKVKGTGLYLLGVHAHAGHVNELRGWLSEKERFRPNIILGDFNAGNYVKDKGDEEIAENRRNYLLLTEGYIDICQGRYTYQGKTQIDHVLLENNNKFWESYSYKNVHVDRGIKLSDHYPIYCEIERK